MRAPLRSLPLAGALVLALASVAAAQPGEDLSTRMISFGIGGGVSVPVNDAKDAFKNGWNGQGFVRFNLKMLPIQPRVEFNLNKFDLEEAKVGAPGTQQIMSGLASAQFYLMHSGPVRPYIVAGLGAYNTKTDTEGVNATSVSSTDFGINGGAGLVLHFGSLVSAYAEGRIDNVYTKSGGVVDASQIQMVPVTFGVVF
jgi:opacity protein-like surface antigen